MSFKELDHMAIFYNMHIFRLLRGFLFIIDCIAYIEIQHLLMLSFYLPETDCDTLFCDDIVKHLKIKGDKVLFNINSCVSSTLGPIVSSFSLKYVLKVKW